VTVYASIVRLSARTGLAYRASFVLGMGGLVFQLLAMIAIWRALIASGAPLGFTHPQMTAYLLVAFTTTTLMGSVGDYTMAERIRSGEVATDLVRPIDYQAARFAECFGMVGLEVAMIAVVGTAVVALAGPVAGPADPVLFAVSLLLVIPIKFGIVYLSSLLCFWTQNYMGVTWARDAIGSLFSGALVPLAFFPGWFQGLAAALPFASIVSTPALVYLGRAGVTAILVQAAWGLGLLLVGRLAWRGAVKQLTVHGG
jgi:ABC-2 type transport system permease protein